MTVGPRLDPATYERLVLEERARFVELHDGVLVEKPPVTFRHSCWIDRLSHALAVTLDPVRFVVAVGTARLRVGHTSFVPDLVVLPAELERAHFERNPDVLAVYDEPVPLVVEVWSPSTGGSDLDAKIPVYRARGDAEIRRFQPIERALTTWVRQADGSYTETTQTGGTVASAALPGVRLDLDALFG